MVRRLWLLGVSLVVLGGCASAPENGVEAGAECAPGSCEVVIANRTSFELEAMYGRGGGQWDMLGYVSPGSSITTAVPAEAAGVTIRVRNAVEGEDVRRICYASVRLRADDPARVDVEGTARSLRCSTGD